MKKFLMLGMTVLILSMLVIGCGDDDNGGDDGDKIPTQFLGEYEHDCERCNNSVIIKISKNDTGTTLIYNGVKINNFLEIIHADSCTIVSYSMNNFYDKLNIVKIIGQNITAESNSNTCTLFLDSDLNNITSVVLRKSDAWSNYFYYKDGWTKIN